MRLSPATPALRRLRHPSVGFLCVAHVFKSILVCGVLTGTTIANCRREGIRNSVLGSAPQAYGTEVRSEVTCKALLVGSTGLGNGADVRALLLSSEKIMAKKKNCGWLYHF